MGSVPAVIRSASLVKQSYSYEDVMKMALLFVKAGMAPQSIHSPEEAAICIFKGLELGLQPMQALAEIVPIYGHPFVGTKLLAALYMRAGHRYHVDVQTVKECQITFYHRNGSEYTEVLTREMADQACFSKKGNGQTKTVWQNMPDLMLQYRTLSRGIRKVAPGCLYGLETTDEAFDPGGIADMDPAVMAEMQGLEDALQDQEDEALEGEFEEKYPDRLDDNLSEAPVDPLAGVEDIDIGGDDEVPLAHWFEDEDTKRRFMSRKQSIGLTNAETLAALSVMQKETVDRIGAFTGSYQQALNAMHEYKKAQGSQE